MTSSFLSESQPLEYILLNDLSWCVCLFCFSIQRFLPFFPESFIQQATVTEKIPIYDFIHLSLWRMLQQSTTGHVASKQWNFISHNSGGWGFPNSGSNRFGVWWESTSSFRQMSSCCVCTWQKGTRELSGVSFVKALGNLIRERSTLMTLDTSF